MKIFFDTETTGVPRNYNAPISDDKNWPRLVQIGYIVMDGNKTVYSHEDIVKPDGFEIPESVSKIHGITTERALQDGRPLADVLDEFFSWVNEADAIVGHNVSFDVNIVGAEFYRLYQLDPFKKPVICTMKASTDFCKIPGPYGNKWPKLHELFRKLFDKDMGAAHTALMDIENTVKCYQKLVELGIIVESTKTEAAPIE